MAKDLSKKKMTKDEAETLHILKNEIIMSEALIEDEVVPAMQKSKFSF